MQTFSEIRDYMFEAFRRSREAKRLSQDIELQESKLRLQELQQVQQLSEHLIIPPNFYIDEDPALKSHRFAQSSIFRWDNKTGLPTVDQRRSDVRQLIHINAHAKNILSQLTNYTVGAGFGVKFKDEATQSEWDAIAKVISWKRRSREIVRRVIRDGECFIRKFGQHVRMVEPGLVKTPADLVSQPGHADGIVFEPDDVETIHGYYLDKGLNHEPEFVEASEILHLKDPLSDFDDMRGYSILYDAVGDMQAYSAFIEYRMIMNKVRAAYAVIEREKTSTPSQINARRDQIRDGTHTRNDKTRSHGFVGAGIHRIIGPNTEIEFPPHSVDGSGSEPDGRAQRLLIACSQSLPEFLVSSDSSNSNYSSTTVAESPGIRTLSSWQQWFADEFERFIEWLMNRDVEPLFTWPPLVVRDELKETQSNKIKVDAKVKSIETWQEESGLDPELEASRMETQPEPVAPKMPTFGGDRFGSNNGEPNPSPMGDEES